MPIIVDGKKIAGEIFTSLQKRVAALEEKDLRPELAVVLVGLDPASQTYVRQKQLHAEKIGIKFHRFEFPETISKSDLISEITKIQKSHKLAGLIVQLPVPEALWPHTHEILDAIDRSLDVDCLSYDMLGRVLVGRAEILPPTPAAILEILRYHEIDLTGKNICLVGRGELIGRPLAAMLMHEQVALSVHGRATRNLADFTGTADIIITGVGKKNILTADMIKEGAIVIDAGINFSGGRMSGDVDFEQVSKKASLITPVPGGVGPVTVAKLLENVVAVCERRN